MKIKRKLCISGGNKKGKKRKETTISSVVRTLANQQSMMGLGWIRSLSIPINKVAVKGLLPFQHSSFLL